MYVRRYSLMPGSFCFSASKNMKVLAVKCDTAGLCLLYTDSGNDNVTHEGWVLHESELNEGVWISNPSIECADVVGSVAGYYVFLKPQPISSLVLPEQVDEILYTLNILLSDVSRVSVIDFLNQMKEKLNIEALKSEPLYQTLQGQIFAELSRIETTVCATVTEIEGRIKALKEKTAIVDLERISFLSKELGYEQSFIDKKNF